MDWRFSGDAPIYLQIMGHIKTAIASGELKAGERLPSVRELALEAEVNPNTMQRALAELEREGLVFSQRTSGRYVTEDETMIRKIKEDVANGHVKAFLSAMELLGYDREEIISLIDHYQKEEDSNAGTSM